MKTSHGVIQGYDGVAAVDDRHQVIVHAEAFGEAQEHELLQPMLQATEEHFTALDDPAIYKKVKITADSGFHTERNAEYLYTHHIDGYLADNRMRSRDPRFQDIDKYKARSREEKRQWEGRPDRFTPKDFRYDADQHTCICPAGKSLYSNGSNITVNGYAAVKFTAPKSACRPCHLRSRCLKFPGKTEVRQVAFFSGEFRKPETLHPGDEAQDRLAGGQGRLPPAHRHRRTGVRAPTQHRAGPLYPPRQKEGRCPVEAVLYCA